MQNDSRSSDRGDAIFIVLFALFFPLSAVLLTLYVGLSWLLGFLTWIVYSILGTDPPEWAADW